MATSIMPGPIPFRDGTKRDSSKTKMDHDVEPSGFRVSERMKSVKSSRRAEKLNRIDDIHRL